MLMRPSRQALTETRVAVGGVVLRNRAGSSRSPAGSRPLTAMASPPPAESTALVQDSSRQDRRSSEAIAGAGASGGTPWEICARTAAIAPEGSCHHISGKGPARPAQATAPAPAASPARIIMRARWGHRQRPSPVTSTVAAQTASAWYSQGPAASRPVSESRPSHHRAVSSSAARRGSRRPGALITRAPTSWAWSRAGAGPPAGRWGVRGAAAPGPGGRRALRGRMAASRLIGAAPRCAPGPPAPARWRGHRWWRWRWRQWPSRYRPGRGCREPGGPAPGGHPARMAPGPGAR